ISIALIPCADRPDGTRGLKRRKLPRRTDLSQRNVPPQRRDGTLSRLMENASIYPWCRMMSFIVGPDLVASGWMKMEKDVLVDTTCRAIILFRSRKVDRIC